MSQVVIDVAGAGDLDATASGAVADTLATAFVAARDAVVAAAPGDGVKIQTCVSAAAGTCDIDL